MPENRIKPLADKVVVRVHRRGEDSLIELPDFYKDDVPQKGTIVAIGPKQREVEVGQDIYFVRYSGQEYRTKDENKKDIIYRVMDTKALMAVVK